MGGHLLVSRRTVSLRLQRPGHSSAACSPASPPFLPPSSGIKSPRTLLPRIHTVPFRPESLGMPVIEKEVFPEDCEVGRGAKIRGE